MNKPPTTEEALLNSIFGMEQKAWRGYFIHWCENCGTYSIGCKSDSCHGSSCNGMGCDSCTKDHIDFNSLNPRPISYLTKEERVVVDKYYSIKKHLENSLSIDKGFDAQTCADQGDLSENELDLFGVRPHACS